VILYPAVDIRDGRAVRLTHGRFEEETVYHDDPLQAARAWVAAGARYLHVVDLDGARAGEPRSLEHLGRIAAEAGVPVQYGGGLRTVQAVRDAVAAGAERVIVGTAALRDVDFLDDIVGEHGPRVVVSVDVRGGRIATSGWTEVSDLPASEAFLRLRGRGVDSFVFTDADRDGALEGPDLDAVRAVAAAVRGRFLYAGGIGSLDHLRALRDLRQVNLAGIVVGKALYEGRFTVAEGQAVLRGKG
jgi:phosphoribosylformimino-5-aminoimidazole carboxamide ribotide isomerase